jgi:hypothetical protein
MKNKSPKTVASSAVVARADVLENDDKRRVYEAARKRWTKIRQPMETALRLSERITEGDLAIRINATE